MRLNRRKIVLLFVIAFFAFSYQNVSAWGDCGDTSWYPGGTTGFVGQRCVPDMNSNESFCESGYGGGQGWQHICFQALTQVGGEYLYSCSEGYCNEPDDGDMCWDPYRGRYVPCWQIWW